MNGSALHGGDVEGAARASGRRVDELLDFSANINPLGPPEGVRAILRAYGESRAIERYPEPGLPVLRRAIAAARDVAIDTIAIHAGSAALFDAVFRSLAPRRIGIQVPAFAEYRRAAEAAGIAVEPFALDPAAPEVDPEPFARWLRDRRIDVAVVTNPHNPLGFATPPELLLALVAAVPATTFVIDEAFVDFDERYSLVAAAAAHPRIIAVRSLTKFYAMPNLRVGYAVCQAARAAAIARFVPAWPVSGIAATAAIAALEDTAYAERTRLAIETARPALAAGLGALGMRVLPSHANYLTFETDRVAERARTALHRHGVIIRDCSTFENVPADRYARVAVRSDDENRRLLDALRDEDLAPSCGLPLDGEDQS